MSEDCMYLNLHVPSRCLPRFPWPAKGPGLPILVFIYGGAFQSGAGLTDAFGPEYMLTKDNIVITFNYRMNFFGFFSLNTIEIPGNQGFRDMVTLLCWVQRNACAFGGDPNNVTVMGQGVILMSCTGFPSYFTTSAEYAKKVSGMFLQELGINQTDPVLIHRELTKIPLLKIMHANTAVQFNTPIVSFNPVVESPFPGVTTILGAQPQNLIAQGRGCEYPLIISYNDNEMASLRWLIVQKGALPVVIQDKTAAVAQRLVYSLPEGQVKEIAKKIDQRYFKGNVTLDSLIRYYTDMIWKHPALKVAEWRAARCCAPTYMYKFSYELGFSPIKAAHWVDYRGAAFLDDLSCVFRVNSMLGNDMYYPLKNADDAMKNWMVYIITNFMTCSNPICNNKALWPSVSKNKLQYNLISAPMRIHMMEPTNEERDMVRFFDSFDPESR
ncbi:Juvenile hormone esterase [Operophtera brumata]|uniref:Juvenile hormone esterase n=1 Tax=Operophtera brumata TaxID=104452 RepID=A0A0L7LFZ6_OPEBR|nr:Juvenile hormone esterase [Operophtera brumata]